MATAGHVDHGKSSLILRLTGMDPDRFAEEKRRGLTIDLGYAWMRTPSGREIGFVDVPGHERFIRNMLAGIGPVRRVLFVVAADEGWKPQSEEHLAIADLLGATAVVALTKADSVDDATLRAREREIEATLEGTTLAGAPIVRCSSRTGEGIDVLRDALDALTAEPAEPDDQRGRPRAFVDRVFTVKGSGTVVTGTLLGGCLSVGDEVVVYPAGYRARIRALQTHKRAVDAACSVSRVALNLVGIERAELERGNVVGRPGDWRPTRTLDARIRLVRGVEHRLTSRGAYKLYAGATEADVRLRLLGTPALAAGEHAYVRIRASRPLVLDMFDPIVLRDAGRRETTAGGNVVDLEPQRGSVGATVKRLAVRWGTERSELPSVLARERGAIRARDATALAGGEPATSLGSAGEWIVAPDLRAAVQADVVAYLESYHREHPLRGGADVAAVRSRIAERLAREHAPTDADLVDALLSAFVADGRLARTGATVALPGHDASQSEREADVARLLAALERAEPTPPSVSDLVAGGIAREVVDAAAGRGVVVRLSGDLVVRPEFVAAARRALRELADAGTPITVSAFRERLGTSRKYAVPLLEHFDRAGTTRREGDVRVLRASERG